MLGVCARGHKVIWCGWDIWEEFQRERQKERVLFHQDDSLAWHREWKVSYKSHSVSTNVVNCQVLV